MKYSGAKVAFREQEAAIRSAAEAEAAASAARQEVESWRFKSYELQTKVFPRCSKIPLGRFHSALG